MNSDGLKGNMNVLTMPPLLVGERFEDVYEVLLILDDREQFTTQGLVICYYYLPLLITSAVEATYRHLLCCLDLGSHNMPKFWNFA